MTSIMWTRLFSTTKCTTSNSSGTDSMEAGLVKLQEYLDVINEVVIKIESDGNTLSDLGLRGVVRVERISSNSDLDLASIGDLMTLRTNFLGMFASCWGKKELLGLFSDATATDAPKADILNKEAKRSFEFYHSLAGICWNFADESDVFCQQLENEGCLTLLVDWMLSLQDITKLNEWTNEIVFNVLNILYNTCRRRSSIRWSHPSVVKVLEKLTSSEVPIAEACAFMALSYMVDKEEAYKLAVSSTCVNKLLLLLKQSLESSDHNVCISRGKDGSGFINSECVFTASELVQGIEQLAINDDNKRLITERGGIDILGQMLKMACTLQEKRHAVEALWQLAFRRENKERLTEEHEVVIELINLSCGPDPALNRACKGALFEIYNSNLPEEVTASKTDTGSARQEPSTTGNPSPHIMISYRWEQPSKSVMREIKEQLRRKGYNVWMDEDFMSGDIIERMTSAVENSYVVLACITEGYQRSKNCRTEATYAYDCNKRIVPVKVNERFKATGWLGGITAGKIYYPVPDIDAEPRQLPRIIDLEIEDELQKIPLVQSGARGVASAEPDIRSWDVTKVREWLTRNGVSSTNESLQSLTGVQLLQLKKQLSTAPDTFYRSMKEDLKVPYMQVLSLAAALESL